MDLEELDRKLAEATYTNFWNKSNVPEPADPLVRERFRSVINELERVCDVRQMGLDNLFRLLMDLRIAIAKADSCEQ